MTKKPRKRQSHKHTAGAALQNQQALVPEQSISPAETPGKLPQKTLKTVVETATFQGPFPLPAHLDEYEKILPGAAERIFVLTEEQQKHRIAWEKTALDAQVSEVLRGQWMGFALGIFMITGAVYCAIIGRELIGIALIGASAASIITAFLRGRKKEAR